MRQAHIPSAFRLTICHNVFQLRSEAKGSEVRTEQNNDRELGSGESEKYLETAEGCLTPTGTAYSATSASRVTNIDVNIVRQ